MQKPSSARNGNGRRFGAKQSYPLPLWNGLLEHRGRMGSAIWEYIWCLDRITREENGIGFVNGGAPVKAKTIAKDFDVDEETVKRNLQRLSKKGYIQLCRTPYGRVIQVMNSLKFGIWVPHKRSYRNVASVSERGYKNVASEPREATKVLPPEATEMWRTKKTQQSTRSNKPPLTEAGGFLEFWREYPRKEARKAAARAWAKIKPGEAAKLMAGLRIWRRSEQWQREGGRFIPHPATFLNGERWRDAPMDIQGEAASHNQKPLDQQFEELERRRAGQGVN